MRKARIGSLLLVLFLAVASRAAEFTTSRVQVLPQKPRLVRLDSVADWCRGYGACTVFISRELTASCVPANESWAIEGHVRVLPRIYLVTANQLPHELTHIRDIRDSAEKYLEDIGGRRYAAEETCKQAALLEETNFGATFSRFVGETQQRHR